MSNTKPTKIEKLDKKDFEAKGFGDSELVLAVDSRDIKIEKIADKINEIISYLNKKEKDENRE